MALKFPSAGNNAIIEALYEIDLNKPIEDIALARLAILQDVLSEDFPYFNVVRSVTFSSNPSERPIERQSGVLFNDSKDNRNYELRVEHDKIRISCLEYTDWSSFKLKVTKTLNEVLRHFDDTYSVRSCRFQCSDKFISSHSETDYNLSLVFDQKSVFLSNFVACKDRASWHIHQGWFEESNGDVRFSILHNLNIDVHQTKEEENTTLITHSALIRSDKEGKNFLPSEGGDSILSDSFINESLEIGHNSNKELIKGLLSDQVKVLIQIDN